MHVGYKLEILVAKAHVTFIPYLGLVKDVYCGLDIQADARPLCIIPSVYPWPGWGGLACSKHLLE